MAVFRTIASSALRRALGLGVLLACVAGAAHGQLFRAYLSSTGSDGNPCTLQQPCRLLPAALGAVANGGEVWMLDSANYNTGAVTIDKSVTILAVPGAIGSFVTNNEYALQILAGNLSVSLRNVVVTSLPGTSATYGVMVADASTLTVEDSLFHKLAGGIAVSGRGMLRMIDSTIRDVTGFGVVFSSGTVGHLSRVKVLGAATGVSAQSHESFTTVVTITDSVISGAPYAGVAAFAANTGAGVRVTLTRSIVDASGIALSAALAAGASSVITLADNTIAGNAKPWEIAGGTIRS